MANSCSTRQAEEPQGTPRSPRLFRGPLLCVPLRPQTTEHRAPRPAQHEVPAAVLAFSACSEKDLGEASELSLSEDRVSNSESTSACSSGRNWEQHLCSARLLLFPISPGTQRALCRRTETSQGKVEHDHRGSDDRGPADKCQCC